MKRGKAIRSPVMFVAPVRRDYPDGSGHEIEARDE
jgi:hypothetical protein